MMSESARFQAKVRLEPSGCWVWIAGLSRDGYGKFWARGATHQAHRWAYEAWVGAIPRGLVLDHLCRNRACVNPSHLEPVTIRENSERGETFNAYGLARTECGHGHRLDEQNTYRVPGGGRGCKACRREASARHYARKVAALC